MKLFDHVIRAVDDPQKQASAGQIGQVLPVVNQLSNQQGLDAWVIHLNKGQRK